LAHCFQHILRQVSAFPEIDVGLRDCLGDVGVGREMKHCIATNHGFADIFNVFQVGFYDS
jgi:hypothetical protein